MNCFPTFLPACLLLALLSLGAGCNQTTVEGEGGRMLTLKKPLDQTLIRGKTNGVRVEIDRRDVLGPVAVEIDQLPAGVQVVGADVEIPRDSESVTVTLHADPGAETVRNHRVTVTAKAPPDLAATEVFSISVR